MSITIKFTKFWIEGFKKMQKIAGVAGVFESLSDNISVGLFTAIAHERINSVVLRNKVKISRKQYYSRLSKMVDAGLIKRSDSKLIPTAFGRIVYQVQRTIEEASTNLWRLRAIDSLEISDDLPVEEHKNLRKPN